jgi:hypothetical protein
MSNAVRFNIDALERVGFTAIEGAVSVTITGLVNIHTWWAVPIMAGLAVIKSWAARMIGNPATAAVLPASADPATAANPVITLPPQ